MKRHVVVLGVVVVGMAFVALVILDAITGPGMITSRVAYPQPSACRVLGLGAADCPRPSP